MNWCSFPFGRGYIIVKEGKIFNGLCYSFDISVCLSIRLLFRLVRELKLFAPCSGSVYICYARSRRMSSNTLLGI